VSSPDVEGASPKTSPQQDDRRHADHTIQLHVTQNLEIIGGFADQVGEADQQADQGSLDAARALKRLLDSGEWVEEWKLEKPIKDRSGRGPKPKIDSQARFNQWVAWRLDQKGYRPLGIRRTNQLILAAKTAEQCGNHGARISSERVIRPLNWMIAPNQQYGRYLPQVMRMAVELAGSVDQVTEAHTKKALAQWLKSVRGSNRNTIKPVQTPKAEHARTQAVRWVSELWEEGRKSERARRQWALFDQEYMRHYHRDGR